MLVIIVLFLHEMANSQFAWQKAYGTAQNDEIAADIKMTSDSGYILLGNNYNEQTNERIYVVRTDQNGDSLWTRVYQIGNCTYEYHPESICQVSDGGFVIAGSLAASSQSPYQGFLMKINESGDTLWSRVFSGQGSMPEFIFFRKIICGNDENIVGIGTYEGVDRIFKFDNSGNLVWKIDSINISDICLENYGYLCTIQWGETNNLIKINEQGKIISRQPAPLLHPSRIKKISQNNYLMTGTNYGYDYYIEKLNDNFDTVWSYKLPVADGYFAETIDKGILILDYMYVWGTPDFYLHKIDSSGNFQKDTILYRPDLFEIPKGLLIAPDGDYILFGSGQDGPIGKYDIIFAKMTKWDILSSITSLTETIDFKLYPNPTTKYLFINSPENLIGFIRITNISGSTIYSTKIENTNEIKIDMSNYISGIYILQLITSNNQIITKKIIKN